MVNSPLVTVIIPTFKRPKLLSRAVDSVKNQTYSNIEIIVVDDANDDNVKELYKADDRITLLVNEQNKGGCFSRNRGIKESNGSFINFLDDDDILYPTKIEKQVACFKENPNRIENLGFITCHTNDGRSGEVITRYNKVRGNIFKRILSKFLVNGIETVLYRSDALKAVGGFDNELLSNHEYDLQIRICREYQVDFIDEVLTEEFMSTDQISVNFDKKLKGAQQLFTKHKKLFSEHGAFFTLRMFVKYQLLFLKFRLARIVGEKVYHKILR